jgi:hypothetical protein
MARQPGDGFLASGLLAQAGLLDLPGGCLRHAAENHAARTLEVCQPFTAKQDDLLFGGGRNTCLELDEQHGTSPHFSSGCDHGGMQDRRVSVDDILDFHRRDDHVLRAVNDLRIPVVMKNRDVAGSKPAVASALRVAASFLK